MKSKIFSTLPTIIDWYDFSLFGFLTIIFSKIYFDQSHSLNHTSQLFGIFAVGFIARPIGSIIFGFIGDKYNRVTALKYPPLIMGFLTAIIGLIPSYNHIGIFSIIILLTIRFLQGIIIGGDFTGNIIYLCESDKKYSNFFASIGSIGGSLGIAISSAIASFIYLNNENEVLWRLAFIICFPIGIISFFLRKNISENKIILKLNKLENPLKWAFLNNKKLFLFGISIIVSHSCSFYFLYVFTPSYFIEIFKSNETMSYINNTLTLFIHVILVPVFGYFSSVLGNKIFLLISFSFQVLIGSLILFKILFPNSIIYILIMNLITAINAGIIPGFLSGILPIKTRYTVFSLIYSIGFGLIGGIIPLLAINLTKYSYNLPFIILVISGLISLFSFCIYLNRFNNFNFTKYTSLQNE